MIKILNKILSLKTLRNENISGAKEIANFLDPRIDINSLAPKSLGFSSVSGRKFS
jgi:hypothetical protein